MSDLEAKTESKTSKFVSTITEEGRVHVDISGPHINNKTLKRLLLAMKKTYRLHINNYRREAKRNNTLLADTIAPPVDLDVEANGRVLDKVVDPNAETTLEEMKVELERLKSPVTKPISKVIESKKLSLNEIIAAKRAKELVETKL